MQPKIFVKLKKTLKTLSSGQKTQKNPKKTQKPKKTHWAGFFFKKPGFFPTLSERGFFLVRCHYTVLNSFDYACCLIDLSPGILLVERLCTEGYKEMPSVLMTNSALVF
jgi:hypothetical protein